MKVLITGADGMLGSEITKQIRKNTEWELLAIDVADLDITKEEEVKNYVKQNTPNVIINCAAYTNVDGCEQNFEICKKVNADAVSYLAKAAKEAGALLVHISTDYVFGENKKEGYNEDYQPYSPPNKYGESKMLGEKALMENTDDYYIIRTAWLFGPKGKNFLSKMIELGKELAALKVVTDEVGSPTYVKDLSERVIWMIKEKVKPGIYHVTGKGICSRYSFAEEIFKHVKSNTKLAPTTLKEFGRTTGIANYSVLNNTKLPEMRPWQDMVKDYLTNEYKG